MLDYVNYSKKLLRNNFDERSDLIESFVKKYKSRNYSCLVFVASGSSFNSALMVKDFLQKLLKKNVFVETPEYLIRNGVLDEKDSFVVVISQSGSSTNILDSIEYLHEKKIPEISLTGNPESKMASISDQFFDYHTGNEYVDFVTTGVQALILYLFLFGLSASDEEESYLIKKLDTMIDYQETLLSTSKNFIENNLDNLTPNFPVIICGDGSNYGVAREAALKFQETLKRSASYYELEEFLHGPDMSLNPNRLVILLDDLISNDRYWEVYQKLKSSQLNTILVTTKEHNPDSKIIDIKFDAPNELNAFFTLPPIQLIVSSLMKKLDSMRVHPFVKAFESDINIKTTDYDKQIEGIKHKWEKDKSNNDKNSN